MIENKMGDRCANNESPKEFEDVTSPSIVQYPALVEILRDLHAGRTPMPFVVSEFRTQIDVLASVVRKGLSPAIYDEDDDLFDLNINEHIDLNVVENDDEVRNSFLILLDDLMHGLYYVLEDAYCADEASPSFLDEVPYD